MSPSVVKTWLVPLAISLIFLFLIAYEIPYAPGYAKENETLSQVIRNLWAKPDWEHASFVPFICIFLVWWRRRDLLAAPVKGSNLWGGLVLLFGTFVYCIGMKAETEYFGYFAVQIFLAGLVLWLWGTRVFAILSFAWFFFIFTWPMPFLDGMVALPLRLVMSHSANSVLNFLGTSTVQSGTAILSAPNYQTGLATGSKFEIDIADPCSGLHSLFALMMMSALAGYLSLKSPLLRWVLFFAAIPLAIAGNVVRILMLVWGTERFGSAFAIGTEENPTWFHMGCGYAVYAVALVLLFVLIGLLSSPRVEKWAETIRLPRTFPSHGIGPASESPA